MSHTEQVFSRMGAILRSTSGNFLEMFDFFLFGFYATYISKAFFPAGNAKALAQEIPGATLLVLDEVGAELPRRAHAEVAAAVLAHTAQ